MALVYIFLVLIIAIVSITSVYNFYQLGKSIDGLMVDNYKSINAVNHMLESIQDQNMSMFNYIYTSDAASVNNYYAEGSSFYEWYNVESNNITEHGEGDYINKVNNLYLKYQAQFTQVQNIKDKNGEVAASSYYNKSIIPTFNEIRTTLKDLTSLNEKAMFNGKDQVTGLATNAMYFIMILSVLVILLGFIVSNFLTNKFLGPLYVLKENMKSIKEGQLEQQAVVQTNDEIGELAVEFNKMTSRLQQFEKSSKGRLMEEKNKSLAIVKSISDPMIVLDTHHRVILLNHACEMFFHIKEAEAISKHFLEVIKNSDIYDHISEAYSSKDDKYKPKIISIQLGNKEFFFDTIVTKVKDEESNIKGIVVLFQNVTKLKKLEKIKTEFVSTISHELKTPLTSIMMGTSIIKNESLGELTDRQREVVETIEEDIERLTSLVNDIIQLSKIESDRAIFHFEPCSIFGIVENCIKGFADNAADREINLYSEVDEKLPKIYADYEKTSWVINNLLSNSLKYTNAGDDIIISARIKDNMMHISVRDTGIGIPEEYKERIFDKFVKVESIRHEVNGTGLGLAISKEIVTIHKGVIWCESEIDVGSTFTFTMPLAS